MEYAMMENPARKKRRKKNPTATAIRKISKAVNPIRRKTSKAGAMSFLKKNGLKAVSSKTANPRRKSHKRRRRNGISAVSRVRNGLFANTKGDAKVVGSVVLGMGLTYVGSKFINSFLQNLMSQIGIGAYSLLAANGLMALVIAPFIVDKIGGKFLDAKGARTGGLAVMTLEGINQFVPQLSGYLPYSGNAAVVINNGQPVATLPAVVAIVNSTNASNTDKAKVAGWANQVGQMGAGSYPTYQNPTPSGNYDNAMSGDW